MHGSNLPLEERLRAPNSSSQRKRGLGNERHYRGLDRRFVTVAARRAQEQQRVEGRQPVGSVGPVLRAVRPLAGENLGADPFTRDAGALGGYRRRTGVR